MTKIKETSSPKQAWVTLALVVAVSGLFGLVVLPQLEPAQATLVGEQAPDFALPVHHGGEAGSRVRLSDLAGKVVVLDFWASWCSPCVEQIPVLSRIAGTLGEAPVRILGINTGDAPTAASRMVDQLKPDYPSVTDADGSVATLYGVDGLPTLVVVDAAGRVAHVSEGVATEQQLREWIREATGGS